MQEIEQQAFVLHSRPYREHQQILDLFTEYDGKVAVVTYLGKSARSNKKALLQPFTPLNVLLKGNGSLRHLSRVEAAQKSFLLSGDHLYSGFYLNELLVRLLGEQLPCEELFQRYLLSLTELSKRVSIELILRDFEMSLLEELGLSFDFSPLFEINAKAFYYVSEQGFVPAFGQLKLPSFDRELLQAIAAQQINSAAVLKCYKLLMRHLINNLLGNKPLHSRKLFAYKEANKAFNKAASK
jgi:DNA repair protein RecO (recombination protein O)